MQGSDWLMVLIIIFLIRFGERKKLRSLNFKKLNFDTFILGFGLFGFCMLWIASSHYVMKWVGYTSGFERQLENPALDTVGPEFVFVYGIFSLITASIAEEIIYRGYATERLLLLGKQKVWVYVLPVAAFAVMHYRKGLDHMIIVIVVGLIMTLYYVKYRNLTLNIIGHFFIDLMAYISILFRTFRILLMVVDCTIFSSTAIQLIADA
jgi:membrane protease YdiL (CAAX protease family)